MEHVHFPTRVLSALTPSPLTSFTLLSQAIYTEFGFAGVAVTLGDVLSGHVAI